MPAGIAVRGRSGPEGVPVLAVLGSGDWQMMLPDGKGVHMRLSLGFADHAN